MITNTINKIQSGKNWLDEKMTEAFCVVAQPVGLLGLGYAGMTMARVSINMAQNGPMGQAQDIAYSGMAAVGCAFAAYSFTKDGIKGAPILPIAGAVAATNHSPIGFTL